MKETLSQRVIKGGIWVFALHIVNRLFALVRTVILARILAPHDFGLMGIALLSMSTLETFSRTGFEQALIQKKKDIEPYLDTAWIAQVIRGFLLFVLLFVGAPLVSSFFHTPEAEMIVKVVGVTELLKGLVNIGVIYFQKEIEFQKQFLYQVSGTFADLIVAILIALIFGSIWALVFGLLAGNFVRLIMSYWLHFYRPRLCFEIKKVKELSKFGRWVLGSSILIFLLNQGDDALVGKLLGITALGLYQMAYRISNMPATEITHVVSQVTFPAYSKLQDNLPRLRKVYLKALQLIAFFSIPLAFLIFILAPEFTTVFLGEKWLPMVPTIQILCLLGVIRSIVAASGPIFLALGRPDIEAKLPLPQLALLLILVYPLTKRWGIAGTAASVSITSCIFIFVILAIVVKLLKMKKKELIDLAGVILFPFFAIVPLLPSRLILRSLIKDDLLFFGMIIALGILTYSIIIYALEKYSSYNVIANLKHSLKTLMKGSYG